MSMQKKSFFSFSHLIIDSYTIGEKKELIVLAVFNNNIHTKIGTELIIDCWPGLSINEQLSDLIYQDREMELLRLLIF